MKSKILTIAFMILFIWINGCSMIDESKIEPISENSPEPLEKIESNEEIEMAAEKKDKESLENPFEEVNDPVQKKLYKVENQYSLEFRQKLESIEDKEYKGEILDDDDVVEAVAFFYKHNNLDILIEKQISLDSIIKLYNILDGQKEETINDYINNVTDPRNDNSIAFILQSNLLDWDVALSAYIAKTFNIPYFIISYKDGSYMNPNGNPLKMTLDDEDNDKILNHPMYQQISNIFEELNQARETGDTDSIKIDKTKEEILNYFEEILSSYDQVYFFINTHAVNSLIIYSSLGKEYIYPQDIYNRLKMIDKKIHFKMIGGHCYDSFEEQLEQRLANSNIEYSLLSASPVLAWEGDLLESIIYSNDGIVTIGELEDICAGVGRSYSTVSPWDDNFYIFEADWPPYIMDIYYKGKGYADFKLRTNTLDLSIFYYRAEYFNK